MRRILILVVVFGCSKTKTQHGPTLEEVLETDGAKLAPLVEGLDKIAATVAAETVKPIDLAGETLSFANVSSDPKKLPNAMLIYADDIKLGWRGPPEYLLRDAHTLPECYQLGKSGKVPPESEDKLPSAPTASWAKHLIEQCAGLKYALVIRRKRDPVKKDMNKGTFAGGTEEGQLLVYQLPSAKYQGGFDYKVNAGDKINASGHPETMINAEVELAIEKSLLSVPGVTKIPER